jgi:hypothetical protein
VIPKRNVTKIWSWVSNFCATIYGPICLGFGIALQLCSSFSLLICLGFWIAFRLEKLEVQTKNQLLDLFFLPSKNSHARTCETLVHRWNSCPMKQMIYELLGNEYYIIENTICAIFLKKQPRPCMWNACSYVKFMARETEDLWTASR